MFKVALIGRSNVGKSTLFNRLISQNKSIVSSQLETTRDRIYAETSYFGKKFILIDTGGIGFDKTNFQEKINEQVEFAINESDLIVFVGDGKSGINKEDIYLAKKLKKVIKPVLLAVNKIDDITLLDFASDFYSLGLGDPILISSIHGIGTMDLLEKINLYLPSEEYEEKEKIKFCFVGKQNVGKSSLVNSLLDEERMIVSNICGTTRDAVDIEFSYKEKDFVIIDTAGLTRRGKQHEEVDYKAIKKTKEVFKKCDVVLFVLDASDIVEIDKKIAGLIFEEEKNIIIIINKIDLISNDEKNKIEEKLTKEFSFLNHFFRVYTSSTKKINIYQMLDTILNVDEKSKLKVKTNELNSVIFDAVSISSPKETNGGILKIKLVQQVETNPPKIVFFVNNKKYLHFTYKRYLENRLREAFDFFGINILLSFKNS